MAAPGAIISTISRRGRQPARAEATMVEPPPRDRPLPLFAWFEVRRAAHARRLRLRRRAALLGAGIACLGLTIRSEEHTSELQSLMRTSYAVFCLKKQIDL